MKQQTNNYINNSLIYNYKNELYNHQNYYNILVNIEKKLGQN